MGSLKDYKVWVLKDTKAEWVEITRLTNVQFGYDINSSHWLRGSFYVPDSSTQDLITPGRVFRVTDTTTTNGWVATYHNGQASGEGGTGNEVMTGTFAEANGDEKTAVRNNKPVVWRIVGFGLKWGIDRLLYDADNVLTGTGKAAFESILSTVGTANVTAGTVDIGPATLQLRARQSDVGPLLYDIAEIGADDDDQTSLAGWWKLETDFNDSAGTAQNGTANGGLAATVGYADFDGVDDYVSVADHADLDLTSSVTVLVWIKPDVVSGTQEILRKGTAYRVALSGSEVVTTINGVNNTSSGAGFTTTAWQLIAFTYDGANRRVYRNGVEVHSFADTAAIPTNATALTIGATVTPANFFNGKMRHVRLYSRALAADEILHHYRNPPLHAHYKFDDSGSTLTDSSGNGRNGTHTNHNTLVASWEVSNTGGNRALGSAYNSRISQDMTWRKAGHLKSADTVRLRLRATGAPTGNITIRFSTARNSGGVTATIDAATLTGSYANYTVALAFGALTAGTTYYLTANYSGGDAGNFVEWESGTVDRDNVTSSDNAATGQAFLVDAGQSYDMYCRVAASARAFVPSINGTGLEGDGRVTHAVVTTATPFTSSLGGDKSFAFWIKPRVNEECGVFHTKNFGDNGNGYLVYMRSDRKLAFRVSDGVSEEEAVSTGTLTANEWNYCVVIYNSANQDVTFYINEALDATNSDITLTHGNGTFARIGSEDLTGFSEIPLDGVVDDLRIYAQALDAAQATNALPMSRPFQFYIDATPNDAVNGDFKPKAHYLSPLNSLYETTNPFNVDGAGTRDEGRIIDEESEARSLQIYDEKGRVLNAIKVRYTGIGSASSESFVTSEATNQGSISIFDRRATILYAPHIQNDATALLLRDTFINTFHGAGVPQCFRKAASNLVRAEVVLKRGQLFASAFDAIPGDLVGVERSAGEVIRGIFSAYVFDQESESLRIVIGTPAPWEDGMDRGASTQIRQENRRGSAMGEGGWARDDAAGVVRLMRRGDKVVTGDNSAHASISTARLTVTDVSTANDVALAVYNPNQTDGKTASIFFNLGGIAALSGNPRIAEIQVTTTLGVVNDFKIRLLDGDIVGGAALHDYTLRAVGVSHGEFFPPTSLASDLGKTANKWRDLYLSGTLKTTGMTLGSVLFAKANGEIGEDNTNFFWDDTGNRLQLSALLISAGSGFELEFSGADNANIHHVTANQSIFYLTEGTGTHRFGTNGANDKVILSDNIEVASGFLELTEISEPLAPASNKARLFVKENGGTGKSELYVRFQSGASQLIAQEP